MLESLPSGFSELPCEATSSSCAIARADKSTPNRRNQRDPSPAAGAPGSRHALLLVCVGVPRAKASVAELRRRTLAADEERARRSRLLVRNRGSDERAPGWRPPRCRYGEGLERTPNGGLSRGRCSWSIETWASLLPCCASRFDTFAIALSLRPSSWVLGGEMLSPYEVVDVDPGNRVATSGVSSVLEHGTLAARSGLVGCR